MFTTPPAPPPVAPPIAPPPVVGTPPTGSPGYIPVDQRELDAAVADLRADGAYQTEFPTAREVPAMQEPGWFAQWLARNFRWLGNMGGAIQYLGIALAVLLGLYLLYLMVPSIRDAVDVALARWRGRGSGEAADDGWRPDAAAAHNLLAEADTLAAQGQYDAAVRLLLGRSIEDMEARRPGLLHPAMTARMIATADGLPAAPRHAFATLARTVERAVFAKVPVSSADWDGARAAYAAFAQPDGWRGAAAAGDAAAGDAALQPAGAAA